MVGIRYYCSFYVERIEKSNTTSTIHYIWKHSTHGNFILPFIDDASISNCITCAVVALYFGMQPEVLAQRMAKLEPVAIAP